MRNPRAQIPTSRHLTELLVHQSQAVQAHLSRKDFSPKTILHGAPFGLRFWCSSNFLWPGEKGFSLKKEHFCHRTLVLFSKAVSSHFGAHPSYLEQTGSRAPRRDDVSGAASLRQHGEGKFQRRWGVVITKTKTFVFCICQDRRTGSGAFCGFWQPPVFQVHQLTHSRFIVIILITIRHYMKINWWGCIL